MNEDYLPFLDLTAWFSTSVPKIYQDTWLLHGGVTANIETAEFLFSTSANSYDTSQLHAKLPTLIVFHPEWISGVVRAHCYPKDHSSGPYYICPLFMRGTEVESLSFNPLAPPPLPSSLTRNRAHSVACDTPARKQSSVNSKGKCVHRCMSVCEDDASERCPLSQPFNTSDFIHLEDFEPISEPITDFTPNWNGCVVKRMTSHKHNTRVPLPRLNIAA